MLPKPISALLMTKYGTLINYTVIVLALMMIVCSMASSYMFYAHKVRYSNKMPSLEISKHNGNYPDLFKVNLFGQHLSDSLNVNKVKQSLLKIKLVGIISATPAEQSFVMIFAADGRDKQVKLGDEIMPGVKVIKIMTNEVLIQHDGQIERLELPQQKIKFLQPDKSILEQN